MLKVLSFLGLLTLTMAAYAQPFCVDHGPYLQCPSVDGMTVYFTTSQPAFSYVEVRGGDCATPRRYVPCAAGLYMAYNTRNVVPLTGLRPATAYAYRIVSKPFKEFRPYHIVFGDSIVTPWETFRTLDDKATSLTLLVLNDVHGDADRLRRLLDIFPLKGVDLVVYNGDMVNYHEQESAPYGCFLDVSTEVFARRLPFLYLRGNHETRGCLARDYAHYVGTPSSRLYHAYYIGDCALVTFDTGEDKADSTAVYAGLCDFDGYREEQARWFAEEVMTDVRFQQAKHKIVLMHIPPIITPNIPAGEEHGNALLHRLLVPLFNAAGVQYCIAAHAHRYGMYERGTQGCDFPVLVNDNHSALLVEITPQGVATHIINDKGESLQQRRDQ